MGNAEETTESPPVAPQDPLLGALVGGKYRVLGPLAQGGMARIYRAEQQPLGRTVALKVLKPQETEDASARFEDRFFLEASTCAKLKHPNTVTVFDYGHHAPTGTYYMVMELVEGISLSELIRKEGRIHPIRALAFAIEVCRSLQEAHQIGIVHRDLKPSNVMVVHTLEGESIKVLDFGIAKVLQEDAQSLTMEDRIVGSPKYMAPEQISQATVTPRTDVYALGVMVFEMIAGHPPLAGSTAVATLMQHLNTEAPRLKAKVTDVLIPQELDDLVASCLEKDPTKRPATIEQLKTALRSALAVCADATDDSKMNTESVIRMAMVGRGVAGDQAESQPTLTKLVTGEHTFSGVTPMRAAGGMAVIGLVAFLLAGVIGVVVGGMWFSRDGTQVVEPPVDAVAVPMPAPAVAPAPAPEPALPMLHLTASQSGAEVWEDGSPLGIVPLDIPLDPRQSGDRVFEVKLDGYTPWRLTQPPAGEDVAAHADLVSAPKPTPRPAPAKPKGEDLEILDAR